MGAGGQRVALPALPSGRARHPLCGRLGGPQGRSGSMHETSSPPGPDLWTVQFVTSQCTTCSSMETELCVLLIVSLRMSLPTIGKTLRSSRKVPDIFVRL